MTLTGDGRRLLADLAQLEKVGARETFRGFSADELDAFIAVIDRLLERLRIQAGEKRL